MQAVLLIIPLLTLAYSVSANTEESMDDVAERFVRASIAYQKQLALKIKQLNGRDVYLFDAKDFAKDFEQVMTPDGVRYKTGTLDGKMVDAVLSQSAQGVWQGQEGAQAFLEYAGETPDVHINDFGVYV